MFRGGLGRVLRAMTKEEVASFLLLVSVFTIGLTDASIYTSTPPSIFNFTPSHNISLRWTYNQSAVAQIVTELAKWDDGSREWNPIVVHFWSMSSTGVFPTSNKGRLNFLSPFTITFKPSLASDVGIYKMTVTNSEGSPPKPTQHNSFIELRIAAIPSISSSYHLSSSVAYNMNYETQSSSSTETFSTTSTTSQEPFICLTTSPSIAASLAHQNTTLLANSITQSVLETSRTSHEIMSGSLSATASSFSTYGQAISTESYMSTWEVGKASQVKHPNTILRYTVSINPPKSEIPTLSNNGRAQSQTTTSRPLVVTRSLLSTSEQAISTKSYFTTWEIGKTSQMKQNNTVSIPFNPTSINITSVGSNGATVSQMTTSRPATENNRASFSQIATPWLRNNGIFTANGSLQNSKAISATRMHHPFPNITSSIINKNGSTGGLPKERDKKTVIGLSIGLPLIAFLLFAGLAYAYVRKMKQINKTYPINAVNIADFVGSNEVKGAKYIAVGE